MVENNTSHVDDILKKMSKEEPSGIKVLIVEDDKMISELLITKLTKSGCVPYSTADGSEAIALARECQPDVIILDLMLPGISGEEILTILKGDETLKKIPVIIFSNSSEEVGKKKILELGADRYFVKAFTNLNDLVADLKILANKDSI